MTAQRIYGDAVAHSFGLSRPPTLVTRTIPHAQIGMSRLSIGADQLGMSPRIPPEDTFILALYLTEVPDHELWSRGRPYLRQGYAPGSMRIVNLVDEYSARITCPHETLVFYLPRAGLDEVAEQAGWGRVGHLSVEPGAIDPVVNHLADALLPAFERPHEASPFFVEHLGLALAGHLVHRYGDRAPPARLLKGGLAGAQLARAKAMMADLRKDEASLAGIAAACGLSLGYFTRAFKASTGVTPHQWRQRHRVEKAMALLLETRSDVAQIALGCGFADQSHLTRVFTRIVGDTPANWRRVRRR